MYTKILSLVDRNIKINNKIVLQVLLIHIKINLRQNMLHIAH